LCSSRQCVRPPKRRRLGDAAKERRRCRLAGHGPTVGSGAPSGLDRVLVWTATSGEDT
jgi:hypothetical protein